MPTPFTHLRYAERALIDPALPETARTALEAGLPEYLLGSVVADGQGGAGLKREETHFYTYDRPIDPLPWVIMFNRYPALTHPDNPAERSYLAGYVFHLAMDTYWTIHMTAPEFGNATWGSRGLRFLMLHAMLIEMDERDLAALEPALSVKMGEAQPGDWLPFLPLHAVKEWQETVYRQIRPDGGRSETFDILAPRVNKTPEELKSMLEDTALIAHDLWENVPRSLVRQREDEMYAYALKTMVEYLKEA